MSQKKPNIPDHILVLGVKFRVELVDSIDEGAAGETLGDMRIIRLCNDQDTRRLWTTLFHEFTHAVLHVIGYGNESDDQIEEMIVQSLEHAVEQFMRAHGVAYLKSLEGME